MWKQVLRANFTDWQKLAEFLELSDSQRESIDAFARFPLNLPRRIAEKIPKGDLNDPLLKQFLPTVAEKAQKLNFVKDPTGDSTFGLTSRLLQKYQGRALLICTSACAMNCRFCFRQNYDYEKQASSFSREIEMIAADNTLKEIILSGGDPLSLSNATLANLLQRISKIPHVRRIRIHTRFPIGIPERIDAQFLELIQSLPQQLWFIIHSNHPKELDEDVLDSLAMLRKYGAVVMNQSVLLRGVNDNLQTLTELCEKLVDNGIVPYYLHQLDRVAGAGHFEVPFEEGKKLVEELRQHLSGYAVPLYVAEIAGEPSKTPLT